MRSQDDSGNDEVARYPEKQLYAFKNLINENIRFLDDKSYSLKQEKLQGDDDVQKLEFDFRGMREDQNLLRNENDSAQDVKKAPRDRSHSKVPIPERQSFIQEKEVEGGESNIEM